MLLRAHFDPLSSDLIFVYKVQPLLIITNIEGVIILY